MKHRTGTKQPSHLQSLWQGQGITKVPEGEALGSVSGITALSPGECISVYWVSL